jgi:excinuclease ABC subunit A
MRSITIRGARVHNLKNLNLTIPRDRLVVVTGVSGSGKSSLAFDTIYAEGQRRYVESLSAYARQFLGQMEKPDVDRIEGLSPAISIEQKGAGHNPRSTVATLTEIYDYLRVVFARVGRRHCPDCDLPIEGQSIDEIAGRVLDRFHGQRVLLLAPIVRGRKGEFRKELDQLRRQGFLRLRVDGEIASLDDEIRLAKTKVHTIEVVVDRIVVEAGRRTRLVDSLEASLRTGGGLATVMGETGEPEIFSERESCASCGRSFDPLHPRVFSFNSPYGACPSCQGLGTLLEVDPEILIQDPSLSVRDGGLAFLRSVDDGWGGQILRAVARRHKIDLERPVGKLSKKDLEVILHGTGDREITVTWQGTKGRGEWKTKYQGLVPSLERRFRETRSEEVRESIGRFMSPRPCPACEGSRLRPESRAVRIGPWRLHRWTAQSVRDALENVDQLAPTERDRSIASQALKEIRERLRFLDDVGLSYLTLDRPSATLSGGESQRIRLATQIGSQLVGVLYVLDEPSIGLHPRDNERLLETLKRLRDLGNTVLVVEHDRETILAADHVVDLGPGAGRHGGELVAQGSPAQIRRSRASLTGLYLSGRRSIPIPPERRKGNGKALEVRGAREHNLKRLRVRFPLGTFIAVTGVSGSGKSTLVDEILFRALARRLHGASLSPGAHDALSGLEHVDKVVEIDQSPIGRTPRSNPATYTGSFTHIRDLMSRLPEAKVRGYKPGRFSFNVKGGRCEACAGDGVVKIEMHFLPDVFVPCEVCQGKRYNRETLEVAFKGHSIADILEMTVEEATKLLANIPPLKRKLETLRDVGLGYIHLGQPATTLSGGEAQRVKLATELSRVATGRTVYILDEPTTGLHFEDIRMLLHVLGRLVDAGNTVIVIEHQLDVIKTADHVIDLGPEGGEGGGEIVAEGTPEEVMGVETSHTGRALRREFVAGRARPAGTKSRRSRRRNQNVP